MCLPLSLLRLKEKVLSGLIAEALSAEGHWYTDLYSNVLFLFIEMLNVFIKIGCTKIMYNLY